MTHTTQYVHYMTHKCKGERALKRRGEREAIKTNNCVWMITMRTWLCVFFLSSLFSLLSSLFYHSFLSRGKIGNHLDVFFVFVVVVLLPTSSSSTRI